MPLTHDQRADVTTLSVGTHMMLKRSMNALHGMSPADVITEFLTDLRILAIQNHVDFTACVERSLWRLDNEPEELEPAT